MSISWCCCLGHRVSPSLALDDADLTEAILAAGRLLEVHGIEVVIENPKGSVRSGVGKSGEKWEAKLAAHYGYIRKMTGGDGEPLDCFIGPDPESQNVSIIFQIDPETGAPDEEKVLFGYDDMLQALGDYLASYSDPPEVAWKRIGRIEEMSMEAFKRWEPASPSSMTSAPAA